MAELETTTAQEQSTRAGKYLTFALAEEANTASRRLLRYDMEAHRQHCARTRYAFPKALYEHRSHSGNNSTLPVFVVGMPRSGTTLVEQIIAGHSRIHGAGELGTIPHVIAGLERWERHTGSGRRYPDCVDDLDPAVSRGIAENVLKELREYAPDADHVVDKLPHNFENIGLIRLRKAKVKSTPKKAEAEKKPKPKRELRAATALQDVWGLIWDGGKLWALTPAGHIVHLDLKTAVATPHFRAPVTFWGSCAMLRL